MHPCCILLVLTHGSFAGYSAVYSIQWMLGPCSTRSSACLLITVNLCRIRVLTALLALKHSVCYWLQWTFEHFTDYSECWTDYSERFCGENLNSGIPCADADYSECYDIISRPCSLLLTTVNAFRGNCWLQWMFRLLMQREESQKRAVASGCAPLLITVNLKLITVNVLVFPLTLPRPDTDYSEP